MGITAPSLLSSEHILGNFNSGKTTLDSWLKSRAERSAAAGDAKTYVIAESDTHQVIGYYSIAMSTIRREDAIGKLSRNAPQPIPMVLLARLAVDDNHHRKGLGAGLLKDCLLRSIAVSEAIGSRGILVHAFDDEAAGFYQKFGFSESKLDPFTLMMRYQDVQLEVLKAKA